VPCRSAGYLRWETKATSYARRGPNILLFSSEFIEIRDLATGRLVQVIEGHDIRGVHASEHAIFVAMRGDGGRGQEGVADKLVELFETADLRELKKQDSKSSAMWDEWDM
jgi:RHO1 GDP-GTP exchange protein 1/2